MKHPITILTFGRFTICRAEQEIAPPQRNGDLLCKLLLCQPNRRADASWLAEQLWPLSEGDQAIQYLYAAARSFRAVTASDLLVTHRQTQSYQLAGQDRLWVDADAALSLVAEAEAVGIATAEALPLFEQAVQYFRRGRFLAGVEEPWVQARRMHLEMMKERALVRLAEAYGQQGQHAQAETLLSEALVEDPTNENLLCHLMQTLHEGGMTHQALRAYDTFVKALRRTGLEPAEATTDLYERLKRAPRVQALPHPSPLPAHREEREVLPAALQETESGPALVPEEKAAQQTDPLRLFSDHFPGTLWAPRAHQRVLDLLCAMPDTFPATQDLGAWLALSAGDLAVLFDAGWTTEGVLDALRVMLQTVQDMPLVARQRLLRLSAAAMMKDLTLPTTETLSPHEQTQLCVSLSASILDAWKLFSRASISQVLALGQAQRAFLQQVSFLLPSALRALFFSGVYRLIGAALFFQARYAEALKAHEQAYLASLEAGDAWNMAESLGWQSGVWKACGEQDKVISLTEAALRLVSAHTTPQDYTTQARLLAQWAESAALLQMPAVVENKLAASAALLDRLAANEEFDTSIWLYYNGTCAFYLGNYAQADAYFEDASTKHPSTWVQQRAITLLFQAQTRLRLGELEGSLLSARMAFPLLMIINAPLLSQGLSDYAESLHRAFPGQPEVAEFLGDFQERLALPRGRKVPRYLEGTL